MLTQILNAKIPLVIFIPALLLILWVSLPFIESRMLYFPITSPPVSLDKITHPEVKKIIEEVYIDTPDGEHLYGWYIPASGTKATVVFSHGNAGNIAGRMNIMNAFFEHGYGILMFDYRGYGNSTGQPSEKGLYTDMTAARQYAAEHYNVPLAEQIVFGESLGSTVAVNSASHTPCKALILTASFTSVPDAADAIYHPFPMHLLLSQKFDAASKMPQVTCPVISLHGQNDTMIPLALGQQLFEKAAVKQKTFIVVPDAGHNDVFYIGREKLFEALETFNSTQL